MASEAQSRKTGTANSKAPVGPKHWKTMRDLWDWASAAELEMERAGKPVTKTDAEQLEAQLGVPVRISRQYGMTAVAWAVGTGMNPWLDERSILLAYSDNGVRWPSGDELRKKEPGYFSARDDRNEARSQLLAEHRTFDRISYSNPSIVERAAAAIAKLREAREELAKLIDDGPLHVVQYAVEKLVEKE